MQKSLYATANLANIRAFFLELQDEICKGLEALEEEATFQEDKWERPGGGGGRSRVLEEATVFEKAGVNFSHVHGRMPDMITQKLNLPAGSHFDATGVSLVIHPRSPRVPIVHMNVRYFEIKDGTHWFGGGIDLTPIYVVPEDAVFFHQQMKAACDPHGSDYYARFKAWCDEYFFIKHRQESRGIGGIFFDHMKAADQEEKDKNFAFVQSVGRAFVPTYREIVLRHRDESFTEREKAFQAFRRSRYVEFNLVYDKGTKFGLDTGGRIESILMSMPPVARWKYNYQPEPDSPEAQTLTLLKPRDWLGEEGRR
jgi:coproporphyrinogen III oxidase